MPPALRPLVPSRQPRPEPYRGQRHIDRGLLFVALLVSLVASSIAAAAPDPTASAATDPDALPTVGQIETRIAEVKDDASLDDASKTALTEQYRRALSNLESTRGFEEKTREFADALTTAPAETAAIQRRNEEAQGSPGADAPLPESLSDETIAQRLGAVVADIAVRQTRISDLDRALERSTARPAAIRARLPEIRIRLEGLETDLQQAAAEGMTPAQREARTWTLETERGALSAEAHMLEQELQSQGVREALYRAQRDEALRGLGALKAEQRRLEERQNERRRAQAEEAQRETERARRDAVDKHPLVQAATEENAEITASTGTITRQLERVDTSLDAIEAEHKRIEADFKAAQQRIEAAGLSKSLGQVLIERRDQLPDRRQYRREIQARDDAIAEATLQQIRYREDERHLRDLPSTIDELVASDPSAQTEESRAELITALEQRRPLIAQALAVNDDYIRQLAELNYAADQLIRTVERYDAFLSERLLWVRSAPPVTLGTLAALPGAMAWLIDRTHWIEAGRVLLYQMGHAPLAWIGLILILLLIWKLSALRRAIRETAEPLRRIRTDSIRHTIRAILLTQVVAAPFPALIWLVGINLTVSAEATTFSRALGASLTTVALGLYYLRAFRTLCMSGGVADRHFRWSQTVLQQVRREFDWLSIYITPVAVVAILLNAENAGGLNNSLGRLALVATMLGFTLFLARLLRPGKGVLHQWLAEHPQGWANRTRHLWLTLIVGTPLALATLALMGYVYTAGVLFESMVQQTWLALALILLHQVIVRWLIVTRRRLALQAAIDRATQRRAQGAGPRQDAEAADSVGQVDEPEPDLAALDEQTRRLINASLFLTGVLGVWLTWAEVLPALSLLDTVSLWHYTRVIDGVEQTVPVSAADVGLVLVILFGATIAARNLPALVEILLLQTESVSAGGRYAIRTLVSYGITVIAFLLAFSTLGLNWGQVQWLVAALGVGIGFGLQEIVANFISGIIILFERPVRVGDIVTIGDTTGVVTNIQIRATTIRNWDRQELLVPNKEFITGRLLNWSLSDQQNRVSIPVGIEYGSDTRKALEILRRIADQNERVLKDPAPLISFEGFGDNALMLVLRCYLNALDGRIAVVTDLHQAIYEQFRANGIMLAFPQRDVHLSQRQPLEVHLAASPPSPQSTQVRTSP